MCTLIIDILYESTSMGVDVLDVAAQLRVLACLF
jgi:hypothetical protein